MENQAIQSDTGGFLRAAENDDVLRFRASTDMIDRHRSIVKQGGIDTTHYSGAFLWGHDSFKGMFGGGPDIKNNLGKVISKNLTKFERSGVEAQATDVDVRFSKVNPFAVLAQGMVREGILGDTSIAFIPKKAHREDIDGEEIKIYDEVELLEISLVPVPSNPEAQALVRSMGLGLEEIAQDDPQLLRTRKDATGTWFFNEAKGWSFRQPNQETIERLLKEQSSVVNDPPPKGADTGSWADVVGNALRDWIDQNRS